MKIALLALLGLILGAIGGAALGVCAGIGWLELVTTNGFEGNSGMLVFFTFMPAGAALGAVTGAALFGILTARDNKIAIERRPARRNEK